MRTDAWLPVYPIAFVNSPWLAQRPDAVTIAVNVHPRASRNLVGDVSGSELQVRIAAPPVDDAANDELVCFLAKVLNCPRNAIQVRRGCRSRHKLIEIRGVEAGVVRARLSGV